MQSNKPTGETMSEGSIVPPEQEAPMPSTIEASIESLNGAAVGDTITLTIESIDDETGMATLVPAKSEPKTGGIEQAASEFEGV